MKNPYIDLHAHLNFKDFDEDRDLIISQMKEQNVVAVNVGTTFETSKQAIELAQQHPDTLWATIGTHPLHAQEDDSEKLESFFTTDFLVDHQGFIVGIGECGLDYFEREGVVLTESDLLTQEKVFRKQIELSIAYKRPLMLHVRESYSKTLEILREYFNSTEVEYRGNAHFFVGTIEEAQAFLDLGFSISFTGVITFVDSYRKLVEYVPLERMFAETDSPYVSPAPFRGKRNNPVHVIEVYKKIAEIKGVPLEHVVDTFAANAKKHWLKS